MITAATVLYLLCFQCAALPAIVRMVRRRSSADLSYGRELLVLLGVSLQLYVFLSTTRDWHVFISPMASGTSVSVLMLLIWRYRRVHA